MGPLASAEFLKTIYEHSLGGREQHSPVVMMYSDPTVPDRTEALLTGSCDVLLEELTRAIRSLRQLGASRIALCCMTIHYLLPKLPRDLRESVVSLLDVAYAGIAQSRKRHLLICSKGTRELRLFETHPQWEFAKSRIVLPDERDQERIHHDLIYPIKGNADRRELLVLLESLLVKYEVDSFVAGCSEVHILAKAVAPVRGPKNGDRCIDPLMILARELGQGRV